MFKPENLKLTIRVNCNGERHFISINKKGQFILHNHNLKLEKLHFTVQPDADKHHSSRCFKLFELYKLNCISQYANYENYYQKERQLNPRILKKGYTLPTQFKPILNTNASKNLLRSNNGNILDYNRFNIDDSTFCTLANKLYFIYSNIVNNINKSYFTTIDKFSPVYLPDFFSFCKKYLNSMYVNKHDDALNNWNHYPKFYNYFSKTKNILHGSKLSIEQAAFFAKTFKTINLQFKNIAILPILPKNQPDILLACILTKSNKIFTVCKIVNPQQTNNKLLFIKTGYFNENTIKNFYLPSNCAYEFVSIT